MPPFCGRVQIYQKHWYKKCFTKKLAQLPYINLLLGYFLLTVSQNALAYFEKSVFSRNLSSAFSKVVLNCIIFLDPGT